jgi:hypothetical protein|tara:strand:- start:563 stop:865 length:303 start_codon:yes stop_codon:yes gene_type:complete
MKLKKQFDRIGGNRLNEAQMIHGVDYSTLKLKSNIDQKWIDGRNMEDDLIQWFKASVAAGGPDMGDDLILSLEGVIEQMKDHLEKDSKNDPFYKSDSYLD